MITLQEFIQVCLRADSGCHDCAVDLLSRFIREKPQWRVPILLELDRWNSDDNWETDAKRVVERLRVHCAKMDREASSPFRGSVAELGKKIV